MAFVVIGALVGPLVIDVVTLAPTGETVRTLAEATLAIVLFADASRIKLSLLGREFAVPAPSAGDRSAAHHRRGRGAGEHDL